MSDLITSTAVFSGCRRYRYTLSRVWDPGLQSIAWVMLNPSIADAEQDDPTIRRCVGFSRRWGFGGIVVVNLFAKVATLPTHLLACTNPVGVKNDRAIEEAIQGRPVVCAWGNVAKGLAWRVSAVGAILRAIQPGPQCLGLTKFGHPSHPLYLPTKARRRRFHIEGGIACD